MQVNNLQSNNTHNASFAPNPAAANQQQGANPQGRPVPPLQSAAALSANPCAKNIQTYNTSSIPQGSLNPLGPDNWNLPEYQPIKPEELGTEKLADEAANTKKVDLLLKHAQEYEKLGELQDAEGEYAKALKYTKNTNHYKLYAAFLKKTSTTLQDEAKVKLYKEKAARAFYYLGALYQKQSAWKEAQAAYQAACDLALYELPLKALLEVSKRRKITKDITAALEKLANLYEQKGEITLAIEKLNESFKLEKSTKLLEKLEALYRKNGGEDSQSQMHELAIQRFELQISQDPKNTGLYRDYAWFLKDIGKRKEARAVKKRMYEQLQTIQRELFQNLQQNVVSRFNTLDTQLKSLEKKVTDLDLKVTDLDFSQWHEMKDADLIPILVQNRSVKVLNLSGCIHITDVGLAPLKGLQELTQLTLSNCDKFTDEGLKHLQHLTRLTDLQLEDCNQVTNASLQHLKSLTQLSLLYLTCCNQVTDAGLQHLKSLTKLNFLSLISCSQVTDRGLNHLASLTKLTKLYLNGCNQITSNAKEQLKKKIPGLSIIE